MHAFQPTPSALSGKLNIVEAHSGALLTNTVPSHATEAHTINMTEYAKMKKPELQALLRAWGLPVSGNKDVLIKRLQDNDAPQAQSSLQLDPEDQPPMLEGV